MSVERRISSASSTRLLARVPYIVGAVLVFAAYLAQIFNLFYLLGVGAFDAGWFAYVMSRFDFPPANPVYLQEAGIYSFFAFHFAPIMPLWGGLAEIFGLSPVASMAVFQGTIHALLFVLGAGLATTNLQPPWSSAFRVFVGASLAFSPIALNTITFPHHELAIPMLFLAACWAISQRRPWVAGAAFALALSVRTDAGFHLFCFLAAFAAGEWFARGERSPAVNRAVILAVVAFAYSVAAFLLVRLAFPQFNNLRYSYLGPTGLFEHVNASFVVDRAVNLVRKRPELVVILGSTAFFGALRRDWATLLGAFAVLPWVALNLLAYRERPGELYAYMAFPFLLVAAWPFAVHALRTQADKPPILGSNEVVPPRAWLVVTLVALLAYLFPPLASDDSAGAERRAAVSNFVPKVTYRDAQTVTDFAAAYERLLASPVQLVLLDEAVRSFLPTSHRLDLYAQGGVPVLPAPGERFVIAYFRTYEQGPEIESMYRNLASDCFRVEGTNIRILSRGSRALIEEAAGGSIAEIGCDDLASASLHRRSAPAQADSPGVASSAL